MYVIYQKGRGVKTWGSRTKDLTVESLLKLLNAISQMHESHEPKQGKNKENHIQGVDILRGNTLVKPLKYRVKEKTLQVAKGNNISSVEQLKEWWLKFIRNNESQKSTEWHLKCWKKFVTKISTSSESRGRTFFFFPLKQRLSNLTEFTASRSTIRNTKENSLGQWEIISDRKPDLQEESRIHKMVGIWGNKKDNFFSF